MIMDIEVLYKNYRFCGSQPCRRDDPEKGKKVKAYKDAARELFSALKEMYESGYLYSPKADAINQVILSVSENPEAFWGTQKTAMANQAIFLYEKNCLLFRELLDCYLASHSVWQPGETGNMGQ